MFFLKFFLVRFKKGDGWELFCIIGGFWKEKIKCEYSCFKYELRLIISKLSGILLYLIKCKYFVYFLGGF